MKPLQSVAMGLVIVVLSARFARLRRAGGPARVAARRRSACARLPAEPAHRRDTLRRAGGAGRRGLGAWCGSPHVTDRALRRRRLAGLGGQPAPARLRGAALPRAGRRRPRRPATPARLAGCGSPARRWSWSALLPVLVFGAGWTSRSRACAAAAAGLVAVLLIWLLFAYAGRALGAGRPDGPERRPT